MLPAPSRQASERTTGDFARLPPKGRAPLDNEERGEQPCGRVDAGEERDVVREPRPDPVHRQEGTDPAIARAPRRQQQCTACGRCNPQSHQGRPQGAVLGGKQIEELRFREWQLHSSWLSAASCARDRNASTTSLTISMPTHRTVRTTTRDRDWAMSQRSYATDPCNGLSVWTGRCSPDSARPRIFGQICPGRTFCGSQASAHRVPPQSMTRRTAGSSSVRSARPFAVGCEMALCARRGPNPTSGTSRSEQRPVR